jgi:hypothetical protein
MKPALGQASGRTDLQQQEQQQQQQMAGAFGEASAAKASKIQSQTSKRHAQAEQVCAHCS